MQYIGVSQLQAARCQSSQPHEISAQSGQQISISVISIIDGSSTDTHENPIIILESNTGLQIPLNGNNNPVGISESNKVTIVVDEYQRKLTYIIGYQGRCTDIYSYFTPV